MKKTNQILKPTIYILMLILTLKSALANNIVIDEVLYDPTGTESGGEFVVLYNPTSNNINISSWAIATESSYTDAVFPDNTILNSNTYYLIADSGFNSSKDNEDWPNPDLEEAITMSNSNSGIALIDEDGYIIDAVGWGNTDGIDEGLYEGTPVNASQPGNSLKRYNNTDTDNNTDDFYYLQNPSPKNTNFTGPNTKPKNNSEIIMSVIVDEYKLSILSINITDENEIVPKIQIIPTPGENKEISIKAEIEHTAGINLINNITALFKNNTINFSQTQNISHSIAIFTASIFLDYYDNPGNYSVKVTANGDDDLNTSLNISFEYQTMAAFDIDTQSVNFGTVKLGSFIDIIGDLDYSTKDSTTIQNMGNTKLDLGVSGTNLSSNQSIIPVRNIRYNFGNLELDNASTTKLEDFVTIKDLNLKTRDQTSMNLRLFIPTHTTPGSYNGMLRLIAISS